MLPGLIGGRKIGETADRDPDKREQHGVGDREPLGERQQQADQPEQRGNGENGLDGVGAWRPAG